MKNLVLIEGEGKGEELHVMGGQDGADAFWSNE
jgi:hypothetical protein